MREKKKRPVFSTSNKMTQIAQYRGWGFGTQCVKELLRIAAEDFALQGVHGGCAKENLASQCAMEKAGMARYGTEDNGDPLYRFSV